MMKKKIKFILSISSLLIILVCGIFVIKSSKAIDKQRHIYSSKGKINNNFADKKFTKEIKGDIIIGKSTAKITLIEYASLSCPHCARFSIEAFPIIDKKYIKTGKIKFIYRNYPLNHPALSASMVAECMYNSVNNEISSEKYYLFIKTLFTTQEEWAFDIDFLNKLKSISNLYGINNAEFDKCISDESLQNRILENTIYTSKSLNINSVPLFIIDGEILSGYKNHSEIINIIEKKLSER